MRRGGLGVLLLGAVIIAAALSGCGSTRQDAHEVAGRFSVRVIKASFPAKQAIAHGLSLELEIRNVGNRTVPNLAVTVDSFSYRSDYPNTADPRRPVWIIDAGPGGQIKRPVPTQSPTGGPGQDVTADTMTWAAGPIAPGQSHKFVWHLTPMVSGVHTISYRIDAGLNGKARAVLSSANAKQPTGRLTARIAPLPLSRHVDPNTGQVIAGPVPLP
jgi:hypothetical protein